MATTPRWLDLLWLLGYVAAAAAACSPSGAALVGGETRSAPAASVGRRLAALGGAAALPGITLLVVGTLGLDIPWAVVGAGCIVLSLLVVVRIAVLVRVVEEQAVQLSALARSDGLTGAPNRRSWDHELGRAVHRAEEDGGPLTVALVDLDHFKRYNDGSGTRPATGSCARPSRRGAPSSSPASCSRATAARSSASSCPASTPTRRSGGSRRCRP